MWRKGEEESLNFFSKITHWIMAVGLLMFSGMSLNSGLVTEDVPARNIV